MEKEKEMETAMATVIPTAMDITHRNSAMKFYMCVMLFFLVACAMAQERPQMSMSTSIPPSSSGSMGFGSGAAGPIGNGDLIEMSVFDTPEFSGKLRVSNTGEVILPLIGKLHVTGMTPEDAASLIRQKLIDGAYLKDPQVTVFIAEYATQNVSVLGEVKNPGIYPAFGAHHLLDYISAAQGLTPLAGTHVTITHAADPSAPEQVKVTAGATPKPENNPEVLPGDTVYVERTGVIFVVGDVMRPGGYPMDHDGQLSLLQAIALAQGTNPTAAKASAKLIRTTPHGRQEIPVNLKKVLQSKSTDLAMQDNDILFIPSSAAKNAVKDFEAALPAAAGASIYRVP
jgi:polysaccharide biosynthesis/export protein